MSEPITLYCTGNHQYGGRAFVPGDVVALVAPSIVREFVASGNWAYTPPEEPQEAPPEEPQTVPVVVRPAKSKSGKRSQDHQEV